MTPLIPLETTEERANKPLAPIAAAARPRACDWLSRRACISLRQSSVASSFNVISKARRMSANVRSSIRINFASTATTPIPAFVCVLLPALIPPKESMKTHGQRRSDPLRRRPNVFSIHSVLLPPMQSGSFIARSHCEENFPWNCVFPIMLPPKHSTKRNKEMTRRAFPMCRTSTTPGTHEDFSDIPIQAGYQAAG